MNYILFDDVRYAHFLPLTHTRPVSELRCGIWTQSERWNFVSKQQLSYKTKDYLQEKFPLVIAEDNVLINSGLFYTEELFNQIKNLELGQALLFDQTLLACRLNKSETESFDASQLMDSSKAIQLAEKPTMLENLWDIFSLNDMAIRADYALLTANRISQPVNATNTVLGNQLFIEEGAKVSCSIINTETGPVYIGKDAEVMEGSIIRGPFAMGDHAVLKMGAKIYGATTLGPLCKVGGEVNNSVFFANSNKAHDGFIGNAVIGEWCNIGADSNNSNLKNNYEEVKLWSEAKKSFTKTGLQFCGLILADHSKCGINTMFNTGTVVGVSCNIYGAGFPRNFIPSFSWGSANGFMEYQLNKAVETASKVFARRHIEFNEVEQKLMQHVFDATAEQRNYNG